MCVKDEWKGLRAREKSVVWWYGTQKKFTLFSSAIFSPKGQAESAKKIYVPWTGFKTFPVKRKNQQNATPEAKAAIQSHMHTHTDLIAGPASEAVRVELVDVENMNGAFDAEVMELAGHFEK